MTIGLRLRQPVSACRLVFRRREPKALGVPPSPALEAQQAVSEDHRIELADKHYEVSGMTRSLR